MHGANGDNSHGMGSLNLFIGLMVIMEGGNNTEIKLYIIARVNVREMVVK
jgi:hypothetical protein